MKENSKKILLFLYPCDGKPVWSDLTKLQKLLPHLSPAGLKSSLFLLDKKDLLRIDKTQSQWRYSLSSYGQKQLEELFPALSVDYEQWKGDWSILVFLQAPTTDINFRYLRSYLTQNKAIALTRAVYLYPGEISLRIKDELQKSYKNAVLVLKVKDWLFGDDFKVIGQNANLLDLFNLYSSISKELDRLTSIRENEKSSMKQEKSSFFSAFNRFLGVLEIDTSLLTYYFPEVESPKKILSKLQNLLRI